MCILRQRSCSEGDKPGPKVDAAILPNTCVTFCSDAVPPMLFANKGEDIQRSKVMNSQTMSEMQAKAVVRLARMQKDLMIVSSLDDGKEMLDRDGTRRSWLTSSSVLLALHSPMLASLLHPGADGLSLPIALPTIDSLLAWLHGEVKNMDEEVERAAEWLGININRPAEKPQNPPQITSKSGQYQGHLLPKVLVSTYNSEAGNVRENEEMEAPECDMEEISREPEYFGDDFEDEIKNRSTPIFSANDTFDALNFDFSYFCVEEEKAKEPEASSTCDQCGYKATIEEELMEHKNSVHRCVHYSCNQCDYESAKSDDLTEHMHSQHTMAY